MLFYQIRGFLLVVLAGITLGLLFDVYRLMRGVARPGRWGTLAGDLGYWLVSGAVTAVFLWQASWGELRLHSLLGLALGAGLYLLFLSRPVLRVSLVLLWMLAALWRGSQAAAGRVCLGVAGAWHWSHHVLVAPARYAARRVRHVWQEIGSRGRSQ
ncbi:MAG: hypothetical protein IMW99_04600 [Firmicutes bacterium]|nr:hypothetical protein [Bacillota bacterium]